VTREHGFAGSPLGGKSGERARGLTRSHRVTGPAACYRYDPAGVRCHVSIPFRYRLTLSVLAVPRSVLVWR
jgi:hypothetical protein